MQMVNGKMFKPFTYGFKIDYPTNPLDAFDMQIIFYVLSLMFSGKNLHTEDNILGASIDLESRVYSIHIFNHELIENVGMLTTIDNSKRLLVTLKKLEHLYFSYAKGYNTTNVKVIDSINFNEEKICSDLDATDDEGYKFEIHFNFKCLALDLFVEQNHGQV